MKVDIRKLEGKIDSLEKKINDVLTLLNTTKSTSSTATQTEDDGTSIIIPAINNGSPQPGPSGIQPYSALPTPRHNLNVSQTTPKRSITSQLPPPSPTDLAKHRHHLQKLLNKRKIHFYQYHRSEDLAKIHDSFLNRDTPYIPRKFQEKITNQDTIGNIQRKKDLEFLKVENYILNLKENAEIQLMQVKTSDDEARSYISALPTNLKLKLQPEWEGMIKKEEEHSKSIWEKKQQFFVNLPSTQTTDSNYAAPGSNERPDQGWTLVSNKRRTPPPRPSRHNQVFRLHLHPKPRQRVPLPPFRHLQGPQPTTHHRPLHHPPTMIHKYGFTRPIPQQPPVPLMSLPAPYSHPQYLRPPPTPRVPPYHRR